MKAADARLMIDIRTWTTVPQAIQICNLQKSLVIPSILEPVDLERNDGKDHRWCSILPVVQRQMPHMGRYRGGYFPPVQLDGKCNEPLLGCESSGRPQTTET